MAVKPIKFLMGWSNAIGVSGLSERIGTALQNHLYDWRNKQ
jgi:hypothetical protein